MSTGMGWGGWAEEEVPPLTDDDAPPEYIDPSQEIEPWELTHAEKRIYEAGYTTAYLIHHNELERLKEQIANLNHEADRLYREAYDHRSCPCWKGRRHIHGTDPIPEPRDTTSSLPLDRNGLRCPS